MWGCPIAQGSQMLCHMAQPWVEVGPTHHSRGQTGPLAHFALGWLGADFGRGPLCEGLSSIQAVSISGCAAGPPDRPVILELARPCSCSSRLQGKKEKVPGLALTPGTQAVSNCLPAALPAPQAFREGHCVSPHPPRPLLSSPLSPLNSASGL